MTEPHETDAVEHTRLGHYLSTYCLHDRHDDCRLVCKVCEAPCRCACHSTDRPAMGSEHDAVVDRNAVEAEFYVCPDHVATGGYESCCECGGWTTGSPDYGRLCSEGADDA